MTPLIEVSGVDRYYEVGSKRVYALKNVNLTVEQGDFIALIGPSGSGKSSLLYILGLLDRPQAGKYFYKGREVDPFNEVETTSLRRDVMGFVFQQFNLLPRVSVVENISMPGLYTGRGVDRTRVLDLIERVGLSHRGDHTPAELSGGQQQRVAIARSLVNQPSVILADEPTGNLDSKNAEQVLSLLKALNKEGITIILVTHDSNVANCANRVVHIKDGEIVSDSKTTQEIVVPAQKSKKNVNSKPRRSPLADYFNNGLKVLNSSRIRSFLSGLGILIGTAALISVSAIGRGAQLAIERQFANLGTKRLVLRPGLLGKRGDPTSPLVKTPIDEAAVEKLRTKIPSLERVVPSLLERSVVSFGGRRSRVSVIGSSPQIFDIRNLKVANGRFFGEEENLTRRRHAVIGHTVAKNLFGNENPIGQELTVKKVKFRVIGVFQRRGVVGDLDLDDVIIVPGRTAMFRLFGKRTYDSVDLDIGKASDARSIEKLVLDVMYEHLNIPPNWRAGTFYVTNLEDLRRASDDSNRMITRFLTIIASISLLVGGIGVMNIMLVSLAERTREVGLRKAVGASSFDILMQFLVESTVLSVLGGVLGIVVGSIGAYVLAGAAGWEISISFASILVAFCFSILVGIVFGIYPGVQASRVSPMEALRFE